MIRRYVHLAVQLASRATDPATQLPREPFVPLLSIQPRENPTQGSCQNGLVAHRRNPLHPGPLSAPCAYPRPSIHTTPASIFASHPTTSTTRRAESPSAHARTAPEILNDEPNNDKPDSHPNP
jgi:hypothetical protein